MHETHAKIYDAVCQDCASQEMKLREKLKSLRHLSARDFGVEEKHICDMTSLVSEVTCGLRPLWATLPVGYARA